MKTIIFFITVLLNTLSAGLFFAWSVSVILGTKKVGHLTYLETMQNMNREILNLVFFIVFFGSLISLSINTYLQFNNKTVFTFLLVSTVIYLIGTFGVTAFGNIPLNQELEALTITNLNTIELRDFRTYYESSWNHYHGIRTISSMVSFILLLISVFIQKAL